MFSIRPSPICSHRSLTIMRKLGFVVPDMEYIYERNALESIINGGSLQIVRPGISTESFTRKNPDLFEKTRGMAPLVQSVNCTPRFSALPPRWKQRGPGTPEVLESLREHTRK
jgi:hypothetical protein